MNENPNFAFVPRTPGALEKVEPGTKRILSGMVADTLALAKKNPSLDTRQKILLVDDDPDLLDMYQEILVSGLPGRPEVQTAISGARALAMLEAERFDLLICNLHMPKMDGLQVLGIVRRKYPQLRTMVLTAEIDERFRHRTYALGVDLYCHKPATEQETKIWLKEVESLLGRESGGSLPKPECSAPKESATAPSSPVPQNAKGLAEPISLLRDKRPARIVWLDDEPLVTTAGKMLFDFYFKDYDLMQCSTGDEAWREISRETPDLFIMDLIHHGLRLEDMLDLFSSREAVTFPILVVSVHAEAWQALRPRRSPRRRDGYLYLDKPITAAGQKALALVSCLPKPITVADLKAQVLKCLGSKWKCAAIVTSISERYE